MRDDRRERTGARRRRLGVDAISGKCVVCGASIVAGMAGMGLAGLLGTGIATANADDGVTTPAIPGSGDSVVFPSDYTINLPFGGVGENNFLGGGNGGDGGAGLGVVGNPTDPAGSATATANAHPDLSIPTAQVPVTGTTGDNFLPGSGDSVVLPVDDTLNLPFGGDGENNFLGGGNGGDGGAGTGLEGNGTEVVSSAIAAANANTDVTIPMDQVPVTLTDHTVVLPGAFDTIVLPFDNTINFPLGGDGENNFLGPGNPGAAGGVGATGTEVLASAHADPEVTTPVSEFTIPVLNDTVVLPGSHDIITLPSGNAINFPLFGDGENNFFGYVVGDAAGTGAGGIATGNADNAITTPMDQVPVTVTNAAFLPGSDDTVVLPSGNTINFPFGGDGLNNFLGAGNGGVGGVGTGNGVGGTGGHGGTGPFGAPGGAGGAGSVGGGSGTGIGVGGDGGNGGNGAQLFIPIDTNGSGSSGPTGPFGGGATGATGATGIGTGGPGGEGGNGPQFFPIDISGVGSSAASDPAAIPASVAGDLGGFSALLDTDLAALGADLGSLF